MNVANSLIVFALTGAALLCLPWPEIYVGGAMDVRAAPLVRR